MTQNYLSTPPTTPTFCKTTFPPLNTSFKTTSGLPSPAENLDEVYKSLNIEFVHSPIMPNPSKVKQNPFNWQETSFIVKSNQLELFARSQQETDRYLLFKHDLKSRGVNILDHILDKELQWNAADLKDAPQAPDHLLFQNPSDLKIIYNQFPYYFEPSIKHLCVWSKVRILPDVNSPIGDISDETRTAITKYIEKSFIQKYNLSWDQILWFKNWESLQSVKSISHIHILIDGISDDDLEEIIGSSGEVLTAQDL